MHDDSRFRILGRPHSASRKTGKKKAKRKSAKKKGQRKSATGARKTARKKRQPTKKKKVGTRASKKLGSRKAGAKKTRKVSKKRVLSGKKSGAKRARKKTGAKKSAKSKPRKVSKGASKRKKAVKKRKTAAVSKKRTRKATTRAKAPPRKKKKRVAAKKRKPTKKPATKAVYVRGEILIDESPELIIRERGEIVSPKEFAPPGHAQVSRRLAPNIYFVDVKDFDDFSEDDDGEEVDRYTTSTSGMHMHNDNYLQLFKQAFFDYMKKTRFEDVDDIPIYRFGLMVRSVKPRSAEAMSRLVVQFTGFLKDMLPRGASAHIIDEGKYISVRMGLGKYREPTTFTRAYDYMARNRELILHFKRGILDYLEDAVWFEWWDTEENYAES